MIITIMNRDFDGRYRIEVVRNAKKIDDLSACFYDHTYKKWYIYDIKSGLMITRGKTLNACKEWYNENLLRIAEHRLSKKYAEQIQLFETLSSDYYFHNKNERKTQ